MFEGSRNDRDNVRHDALPSVNSRSVTIVGVPDKGAEPWQHAAEDVLGASSPDVTPAFCSSATAIFCPFATAICDSRHPAVDRTSYRIGSAHILRSWRLSDAPRIDQALAAEGERLVAALCAQHRRSPT